MVRHAGDSTVVLPMRLTRLEAGLLLHKGASPMVQE